ncbi:MAG: hypothetical protein RLY30_1624 [Pseudomonadota bacterium]|jgi:H+/Cl- antiporter ClcA
MRSLLRKALGADRWRLQRNTERTRDYLSLFGGAALVALCVIALARVADGALSLGEQLFAYSPWAFLLITPLGFALIRYITFAYAPYAAGSGIPQTMAAIRVRDLQTQLGQFLSPLQVALKMVLVCVGLLCGASIGREGPSIQVGAAAMLAWAHRFGGKLRVPTDALIVAGGAGGLAAAFNTPLAGIVFAMEELAKGRSLRQTWFVLMTILGAGFISLALQGNYDFFPIYVRSPSQPELLAWIALALVCGVVAGLMCQMLVHFGPKLVPESRTALHAAFVAGSIGLIVALIALLTKGETMGTGYHAASDLLNTPLGLSHELGHSLLKLVSTVLSYLSGIPGGIFTPSLSIGAGLGFDFALIFNITDGRQMLVLVGMTAFLAGVVQAPVTATVIVMEMTSSQDQFMSLMLSSVIATLVARSISRASLYEILARRLIEGLQPHSKKLSET